MAQNYNIVHDKRQLNSLSTMLKRLPEDWKRDEATMAIFRKASKPMLVEGRRSLLANVAGFRNSANGVFEFKAKVDRTKTIMRVGLVNKGIGRLGHLFNFGTAERVNYSSGVSTGRISASNFGGGWWDRAVGVGKPQVEAAIDKIAPAVIGRYVRKYKR